MSLKSILHKIKALFEGLSQSSADQRPQIRNKRLHERFDLTRSKLFRASLPDGSIALILDLSFNGIRLKCAWEQATVALTIKVLSREFSADVAVSHRGLGYIGGRFNRTSSILNTHLQPLLEPLHQGFSIRRIDVSMLKSSIRESYEWVCRGEGPSDLLIASTIKPCKKMIFTFRMKKEYLEVQVLDQMVSTARSIDEEGRAARMMRDPSPHPLTLEQALLILTGAGARPEMAGVVKPLIELLDRQLKDLYRSA